MKKQQTTNAVMHEGRFIRFRNDNGWEYIERVNCTGIVIVLPLTDDGKVVFTEQYRLPIRGSVIEYPAGLINDQEHLARETPVRAARRELLEETGYRAKRMERILSGPAGSGTSADHLIFYLALGLTKIHSGGGDSTESIRVHEVPLQRVEQWLERKRKKGAFVDPKIYAGLYFFHKYNRSKRKREKVG